MFPVLYLTLSLHGGIVAARLAQGLAGLAGVQLKAASDLTDHYFLSHGGSPWFGLGMWTMFPPIGFGLVIGFFGSIGPEKGPLSLPPVVSMSLAGL